MTRPGKDEVAAVFAEDGPLARAFAGYEMRRSQVEMALAVWRAFSTSRHAIMEGGTGTGKSLAYLVPAVLWARARNEKVVVSTNTINLQEQLIHKDLPALSQALQLSFKFALVKGRANYVCRRKLARVAEGVGIKSPPEPGLCRALTAILAELPDVATGSKSDFHSAIPAAIWDSISSDSMSCVRAKCPYASVCYFGKARREMEEADIIVTNHHLLFSDVALRTAFPGAPAARVLPDYRFIVFDEAHNVPDVAADMLGRRASMTRMRRACQDLVRKDRDRRASDGGLLPSLRARLFRDTAAQDEADIAALARLVDAAIEDVKRLRETVDWFFDSFSRAMERASCQGGAGFEGERCEHGLRRENEALADLGHTRQRAVRLAGRVTSGQSWEEEAVPAARQVVARASQVARDLTSIIDGLADLGDETDDGVHETVADIQGAAARLSMESSAVDFVMRRADDGYVYWAEMTSGDTALMATPLEVGPVLREHLFSEVESAVLTSATMAVRGDFGFFRKEVGLVELSESPMELVFESPFDFRSQALLAVARDLPQPQDPGFQDAAAKAVSDIVMASRGRAFVLFTSMDMLDHAHGMLRSCLEGSGIPVFRQGEMPRHHMLDSFRKMPGVLLGADSFWQGVDVPGEALSCVILVKLPFHVPTSPIVEAKMEAAERAGESGFYSYALPSAVVRFRQGFGRLIRSCEDRGVVVVLDRRLVEKPYGRVFLSSLPRGVECFTGSTSQIISVVRAWLA